MSGMNLESPHRGRERVLVYGTAGVGKTNGWWEILKNTPDDVTFYVVDTDFTVVEFLDSDENADELEERLEWEEVFDFADAKKAIREYAKKADRGDWLVVDRIGQMWTWAQNYFCEEVFDQGKAEHGIAWRREAVQGDDDDSNGINPFNGTMDWPYIKDLYYKHIQNPAVVRNKAHVYVTAGEKQLIDHFEDASTKRRFNSEGYKPNAEKTLIHGPRTVLRLKGMDPWRFSTIKDRKRDVKQSAKMRNFARDYLISIGGWRPKSKKEKAA